MQEKILKNKKNGMAVLLIFSLLYIAAIVGLIFGCIYVETSAAAIALLIFSVRLILTLLLRLQLLPVLIWLCVGRVYPQWAAAHPFVFYGVLSLFGLLALSCWLRPLVEWLQETQKARLAERLILDELHRAAVEGRTISGFQVKNGVPIAEYEK